MRLQIHPESPHERLLWKTVTHLEADGTIIFPTSLGYAFGANIHSKKGVKKILSLASKYPDIQGIHCLCKELKTVAQFSTHLPQGIFKLMKHALPGPYVFKLTPSKEVPKYVLGKKKVLGFSIDPHPIAQGLLESLKSPLIYCLLPIDQEEPLNQIDPISIREQYKSQIGWVIDGGDGTPGTPTILDCSRGENHIQILSEGDGDLAELNIEVPTY